MENIPDQEEVEYPIKEDLWNTESNIVRYTVKNNLHKQIFYEFRFLSANGECACNRVCLMVSFPCLH